MLLTIRNSAINNDSHVMPGVVYAITAKNNIITAATGDNIALGTANHSVIAVMTTNPLKANAPLVINLRFDIKSRYFQAVAHAQIGDASAVAVATLDRGAWQIIRLSQRLSRLADE